MTADEFPATLGASERWTSLAAVVVGIGGTSLLGIVVAARTGEPRWIFLGLPISVMLWVLARLAPTGYRLAADGLHVERRSRPVVIPYPSIHAVDREPRPIRGLSATASNGLFGRFGRFWNTTLGVYRLYLVNTSSIVWLRTSDGWVGLSPDRPDEFVARLRTRLPGR
jgi:hypothetical protein